MSNHASNHALIPTRPIHANHGLPKNPWKNAITQAITSITLISITQPCVIKDTVRVIALKIRRRSEVTELAIEEFTIDASTVVIRVRDEYDRPHHVALKTRMLADLLGRNTPLVKTDVSLLEVQDRKREFVSLLFDNVDRGVLKVRGNGTRNSAYRFAWACAGFAPQWQPSEDDSVECAERFWAHARRLREKFAEFYAVRYGEAE